MNNLYCKTYSSNHNKFNWKKWVDITANKVLNLRSAKGGARKSKKQSKQKSHRKSRKQSKKTKRSTKRSNKKEVKRSRKLIKK